MHSNIAERKESSRICYLQLLDNQEPSAFCEEVVAACCPSSMATQQEDTPINSAAYALALEIFLAEQPLPSFELAHRGFSSKYRGVTWHKSHSKCSPVFLHKQSLTDALRLNAPTQSQLTEHEAKLVNHSSSPVIPSIMLRADGPRTSRRSTCTLGCSSLRTTPVARLTPTYESTT